MPYRLAPPQHAPVPLRAVVAFACVIFLALAASAALLLPDVAVESVDSMADSAQGLELVLEKAVGD
ncbi:MAG: hypothetical protein Q8O81_18050 [Giesbergeria sp.]|nr:hypothetical protein [Giesbergeria sp.]